MLRILCLPGEYLGRLDVNLSGVIFNEYWRAES